MQTWSPIRLNGTPYLLDYICSTRYWIATSKQRKWALLNGFLVSHGLYPQEISTQGRIGSLATCTIELPPLSPTLQLDLLHRETLMAQAQVSQSLFIQQYEQQKIDAGVSILPHNMITTSDPYKLSYPIAYPQNCPDLPPLVQQPNTPQPIISFQLVPDEQNPFYDAEFAQEEENKEQSTNVRLTRHAEAVSNQREQKTHQLMTQKGLDFMGDEHLITKPDHTNLTICFDNHYFLLLRLPSDKNIIYFDRTSSYPISLRQVSRSFNSEEVKKVASSERWSRNELYPFLCASRSRESVRRLVLINNYIESLGIEPLHAPSSTTLFITPRDFNYPHCVNPSHHPPCSGSGQIYLYPQHLIHTIPPQRDITLNDVEKHNDTLSHQYHEEFKHYILTTFNAINHIIAPSNGKKGSKSASTRTPVMSAVPSFRTPPTGNLDYIQFSNTNASSTTTPTTTSAQIHPTSTPSSTSSRRSLNQNQNQNQTPVDFDFAQDLEQQLELLNKQQAILANQRAQRLQTAAQLEAQACPQLPQPPPPEHKKKSTLPSDAELDLAFQQERYEFDGDDSIYYQMIQWKRHKWNNFDPNDTEIHYLRDFVSKIEHYSAGESLLIDIVNTGLASYAGMDKQGNLTDSLTILNEDGKLVSLDPSRHQPTQSLGNGSNNSISANSRSNTSGILHSLPLATRTVRESQRKQNELNARTTTLNNVAKQAQENAHLASSIICDDEDDYLEQTHGIFDNSYHGLYYRRVQFMEDEYQRWLCPHQLRRKNQLLLLEDELKRLYHAHEMQLIERKVEDGRTDEEFAANVERIRARLAEFQHDTPKDPFIRLQSSITPGQQQYMSKMKYLWELQQSLQSTPSRLSQTSSSSSNSFSTNSSDHLPGINETSTRSGQLSNSNTHFPPREPPISIPTSTSAPPTTYFIDTINENVVAMHESHEVEHAMPLFPWKHAYYPLSRGPFPRIQQLYKDNPDLTHRIIEETHPAGGKVDESQVCASVVSYEQEFNMTVHGARLQSPAQRIAQEDKARAVLNPVSTTGQTALLQAEDQNRGLTFYPDLVGNCPTQRTIYPANNGVWGQNQLESTLQTGDEFQIPGIYLKSTNSASQNPAQKHQLQNSRSTQTFKQYLEALTLQDSLPNKISPVEAHYTAITYQNGINSNNNPIVDDFDPNTYDYIYDLQQEMIKEDFAEESLTTALQETSWEQLSSLYEFQPPRVLQMQLSSSTAKDFDVKPKKWMNYGFMGDSTSSMGRGLNGMVDLGGLAKYGQNGKPHGTSLFTKDHFTPPISVQFPTFADDAASAVITNPLIIDGESILDQFEAQKALQPIPDLALALNPNTSPFHSSDQQSHADFASNSTKADPNNPKTTSMFIGAPFNPFIFDFINHPTRQRNAWRAFQDNSASCIRETSIPPDPAQSSAYDISNDDYDDYDSAPMRDDNRGYSSSSSYRSNSSKSRNNSSQPSQSPLNSFNSGSDRVTRQSAAKLDSDTSTLAVDAMDNTLYTMKSMFRANAATLRQFIDHDQRKQAILQKHHKQQLELQHYQEALQDVMAVLQPFPHPPTLDMLDSKDILPQELYTLTYPESLTSRVPNGPIALQSAMLATMTKSIQHFNTTYTNDLLQTISSYPTNPLYTHRGNLEVFQGIDGETVVQYQLFDPQLFKNFSPEQLEIMIKHPYLQPHIVSYLQTHFMAREPQLIPQPVASTKKELKEAKKKKTEQVQAEYSDPVVLIDSYTLPTSARPARHHYLQTTLNDDQYDDICDKAEEKDNGEVKDEHGFEEKLKSGQDETTPLQDNKKEEPRGQEHGEDAIKVDLRVDRNGSSTTTITQSDVSPTMVDDSEDDGESQHSPSSSSSSPPPPPHRSLITTQNIAYLDLNSNLTMQHYDSNDFNAKLSRPIFNILQFSHLNNSDLIGHPNWSANQKAMQYLRQIELLQQMQKDLDEVDKTRAQIAQDESKAEQSKLDAANQDVHGGKTLVTDTDVQFHESSSSSSPISTDSTTESNSTPVGDNIAMMNDLIDETTQLQPIQEEMIAPQSQPQLTDSSSLSPELPQSTPSAPPTEAQNRGQPVQVSTTTIPDHLNPPALTCKHSITIEDVLGNENSNTSSSTNGSMNDNDTAVHSDTSPTSQSQPTSNSDLTASSTTSAVTDHHSSAIHGQTDVTTPSPSFPHPDPPSETNPVTNESVASLLSSPTAPTSTSSPQTPSQTPPISPHDTLPPILPTSTSPTPTPSTLTNSTSPNLPPNGQTTQLSSQVSFQPHDIQHLQFNPLQPQLIFPSQPSSALPTCSPCSNTTITASPSTTTTTAQITPSATALTPSSTNTQNLDQPIADASADSSTSPPDQTPPIQPSKRKSPAIYTLHYAPATAELLHSTVEYNIAQNKALKLQRRYCHARLLAALSLTAQQTNIMQHTLAHPQMPGLLNPQHLQQLSTSLKLTNQPPITPRFLTSYQNMLDLDDIDSELNHSGDVSEIATLYPPDNHIFTPAGIKQANYELAEVKAVQESLKSAANNPKVVAKFKKGDSLLTYSRKNRPITSRIDDYFDKESHLDFMITTTADSNNATISGRSDEMELDTLSLTKRPKYTQQCSSDGSEFVQLPSSM